MGESDPLWTPEPASKMLPELYQAYSHLYEASRETTRYLDAAWQRPIRPNLSLERLALVYALRLQAGCQMALEVSDVQLFLAPTLGNPAARYDLQAAVNTLPQLLPFASAEGSAFVSQAHASDPASSIEAGMQALNASPALFEQWHLWLWVKQAGLRGVPSTPALTLAAGCTRLAGTLEAVVDWQA
jgi:hypothetical protein